MTSLSNYSPSDVTVSFLEANVVGFAEGTFIEIERNEATFTEYVGSLGEVCHTRSLNRTAKVTLTLMQTSPSNDLLALYAKLDEGSGNRFGPFMMKDTNGATVCLAPETRISGQPKVERGKESGTVVWSFIAAHMVMWAGGNVI